MDIKLNSNKTELHVPEFDFLVKYFWVPKSFKAVAYSFGPTHPKDILVIYSSKSHLVLSLQIYLKMYVLVFYQLFCMISLI